MQTPPPAGATGATPPPADSATNPPTLTQAQARALAEACRSKAITKKLVIDYLGREFGIETTGAQVERALLRLTTPQAVAMAAWIEMQEPAS